MFWVVVTGGLNRTGVPSLCRRGVFLMGSWRVYGDTKKLWSSEGYLFGVNGLEGREAGALRLGGIWLCRQVAAGG